MNMIARRIPVRAPSNASLIERLSKDGLPVPPNRNPVYARATVQETARTFMEVSSGVDGSGQYSVGRDRTWDGQDHRKKLPQPTEFFLDLVSFESLAKLGCRY